MAGQPLSIGFEAHDGSGKTTTAEILALMLGNAPTWIPDSKTQNSAFLYKEKRKKILDEHPEETTEKIQKMDQSYRDEAIEISSYIQHIDSDFFILDRTYASHAAETFAKPYRVEENSIPTDIDHPQLSRDWPEGMFQPDVVFQIILPEQVRKKRITERADARGETLHGRDLDLINFNHYRGALESAREQLGCIRIQLRERNPRTAAMRILQYIMSSKQGKLSEFVLDQEHLEKLLNTQIGWNCEECKGRPIWCTPECRK